ncbi:MAG TPA: amidohydrolase family protein [Polyangiaceae bacterium]|jgi:predicted TIM-barrel fold metal-dependent hydrolase
MLFDAHAHLPADDPAGLEVLSEFDLKVLNISIGLDARGDWRKKPPFPADRYRDLGQRHPERFRWCTSFDLPRFDDPGYVERVIEQLDQDFSAGAIACKVWKNIGMEARTPEGDFVMVDHPILEPIFRHLEKLDRVLILHIGEPRACWEPLNESSPHYEYYRDNPEWHMHSRPDFPSHQALVDARDRVVARHPKLRMIGAHLGSLEYDVAEIAKRLDSFPNFAVDTAARMGDLALKEPPRVRDFFTKYEDRVLWGSDLIAETPLSELPKERRQPALDRIRAGYQTELDYYTSDVELTVARRSVKGISLSEAIQRKLFEANARRWFGQT